MVWMTTMPKCANGTHEECPGFEHAGHDKNGNLYFGGTICECPCHSKKTDNTAPVNPSNATGGG